VYEFRFDTTHAVAAVPELHDHVRLDDQHPHVVGTHLEVSRAGRI
jgi:hypothetical protein